MTLQTTLLNVVDRRCRVNMNCSTSYVEDYGDHDNLSQNILLVVTMIVK